MSESQFWGRKTFCLITGASQGIGRQLAIEMGRCVVEGSLFLLMARSIPGLQETARLVSEVNPSTKISNRSTDLSQPSVQVFTEAIQSALAEAGMEPKDFQLALIVHNAASVGDVSQSATEMSDPQKWADYLSLNFISVTCLNAVFLSVFPADHQGEVCVLNITSLCGVKAFKSLGYYCVGKAAREMYFKVLAEENPTLNVVSYSPGPVETDMFSHVMDNVGDAEVQSAFVEMSRTILSPEVTCKRCVAMLAARKYKSGDRVDYFDQTN